MVKAVKNKQGVMVDVEGDMPQLIIETAAALAGFVDSMKRDKEPTEAIRACFHEVLYSSLQILEDAYGEEFVDSMLPDDDEDDYEDDTPNATTLSEEFKKRGWLF